MVLIPPIPEVNRYMSRLVSARAAEYPWGMRLSKIKLAGFKSFVDPTTVWLPSSRVGVVGPNGCGKSNIIDAVRWVMGESSAKNLRGEAMTDVIFNGSSQRKPVGQASIELVFDNADGSLGGQYASFAEISVKRVVTRDAVSSYFLNGTRCRRRDVQDLFLGTGLGPRSYAIIEQGMISRLIEAKPEELRVFIEEAAGISKYKERRKETEARIKETRENLVRLNDLREELGKQLERLQRQARTAEKYTQLKQAEREAQAQCLGVRLRDLGVQSETLERDLGALEIELEAVVAQQRHAEAALETLREQHAVQTAHFNDTQAWFYRVGAEIARSEQAIQHTKEREESRRADLQQVVTLLAQLATEISADQAKQEQLAVRWQAQEPAFADAQQAELAAHQVAAQAQQALQAWEHGWDAFNQRSTVPTQAAQAERTRINERERHLQQLQHRIERLRQELSHCCEQPLAHDADNLEQQIQRQDAEATVLREQLQRHTETVQRVRETLLRHGEQLNVWRNQLQRDRGRLASLLALQQDALGENDAEARAWLAAHQLDHSPRLARVIHVEPGYEAAAEAVLDQFLDALCVSDVHDVAAQVSAPVAGNLVLVDEQHGVVSPIRNDVTSLATQLRGHAALTHLAAHAYLADDLSQALQRRHQLADHELWVTPQGIMVGANWVRWDQRHERNAGVLAREREIAALQESLTLTEAQEAETVARIEADRAALAREEAEQDERQQQLQHSLKHASALHAQHAQVQTRLEHLRAQMHRLQAELAELTQQREDDQTEILEAQERLHQALSEAEELAEQRDQLHTQREALRAQLQHAQQQAAETREQRHQAAMQLEATRAERRSVEDALQRLQAQYDVHEQRRMQLTNVTHDHDIPLQTLQAALETKLAERLQAEDALTQARDALSQGDHDTRQREGERAQAERRAQEFRQQLESARLRRQEMRGRAQTWHEQLQTLQVDLAVLLEQLPSDTREDTLQAKLHHLGEQIDRLGPINLAAIDEYREQAARQQYLDAQFKDLTEALETLDNAIRKIDRETRAMFKDTFDRVNEGFQRLFPRMFGGGQATLEMTGDDLLETGIAVMARPPGKRNSTIHLLSGGEKALTAVSLVFAIFELNPAPFCMLDEVDAPLDEANVGRFCDLVKAMSERVQFIFITHNKQAMEMANHLIGVTMHEPGVSRPVSVDLEEAERLAAIA
jgi:chromosome segregation protein